MSRKTSHLAIPKREMSILRELMVNATRSCSQLAQANSGSPCGIAQVKPAGSKTCKHTYIVALGVLDKDKLQSPVDLGGSGDGRDFDGVDIGTGKAEWQAGGSSRTKFVGKILKLIKVIGVLRFPVNPVLHLSDAARNITLSEGDVIPCNENVCAICNREYVIKRRQEAVAVTQVRTSRFFPRSFFGDATARILVASGRLLRSLSSCTRYTHGPLHCVLCFKPWSIPIPDPQPVALEGSPRRSTFENGKRERRDL